MVSVILDWKSGCARSSNRSRKSRVRETRRLSEELDPNKIRDVEIRRLVEMAELAFRNTMDRELRIRTRESWYQKFTNAVLALDQLLKSSQYAEFERRLRFIEESKRLRRTVLFPTDAQESVASAKPKEQQSKKLSESSNGRIG